MPDGGDENQLMDELRRLEQSARNYQQEVSFSRRAQDATASHTV